MNYGKEVILDLHDCKIDKFNPAGLEEFCIELCEAIDMEREEIHFWKYPEEVEDTLPDHLVGTSCVQFIRTSNITIHSLTRMKRVYINIFSCKDFDAETAVEVCLKYFGGDIKNGAVVIDRV